MHSMIRAISSLAAGLALALSASAAEYPSKPIRLIVPVVAGGSTDVLARFIGERMGRNMGQPVVVDNRAGAGGSLGTAEAARSAPDGYTIMLGTSSTHAINPAVYPKLRYDALNDFAPITTLAFSEYALVVPSSSPYRTISELLKAKEKLRYASNGNGTTSHLASALLALRTGNEFIHIPYKSSAPAMQDLMGGQVDFLIDNTSTAMQNASTGKLRVLATTGPERAAATKNIPTFREAGVPHYAVIGWWVFLAPADTPPAIVDRLNAELIKAINDPEVRKRLVSMGNDPVTKTPAETRAFMEAEMKKFKEITTAIRLQLD